MFAVLCKIGLFKSMSNNHFVTVKQEHGLGDQKSSTETNLPSEISCTAASPHTNTKSKNAELHNDNAKREDNRRKIRKMKVVDDPNESKRRRNEAVIKFRRKAKERRKKIEEMMKEKTEEVKRLDEKLKSAELNCDYWEEIEGTSKADKIKEDLSKFALNLKKTRK